MSRRFSIVALAFLGVASSACRFDSAERAAVPKTATIVRIVATPEGCPPIPARVPTGLVEVVASNLDAPMVSEIEIRTANLSQVLGEKENLIQGLSGQFTARLSAGRYIVNCPGAIQSRWDLDAIAGAGPKSAGVAPS